ncbi:MAG: lytic murein transglycosylase [Rhodospirillales bacterium]|nr:lytic murein transglycosylase [Rhodospirillales bacterium]HIJ42679.1 lytic murein transglycosylase [Rhodospirillaceae bacterium]MDP7098132.1 lytic murein transglycosylase [Rhodospirillales bacterium]MDP7214475.1 lytic murein transglycosylase [Rhodospirillales bacterium]HIJ91806.1 lytic murein transglycosylase [Rhodospirillaceae bacterium]
MRGFDVCRRGICGAAAALLLVLPAQAETLSFARWLEDLRQDALRHGVSAATLDSALSGIKPIARVIELDRKQPEFTLTFRQYQERVVPKARVEKGKRKLSENRTLLKKVGERFGVQPRFIVAFWGIETGFGRITGGYPVIAALTTLAFDGRRGAYFRRQLLDALTILDQGHIDIARMVGSWAGAMGQCQFMPSSFLAYAVDFDGDGRKDIWNSKEDVFASAANYLSRSGWRNDQTWGRPVKLPQSFDLYLADLKLRKRLSEWQRMGVRRANGADLPKRDLMASVVLAEGQAGPAFVVYNNYRAILKWNRSTFFAVAVGSLADRIGGG